LAALIDSGARDASVERQPLQVVKRANGVKA
jgi:hypothetical protein